MNDRTNLRWGYALVALLVVNYFAWLIVAGVIGGFAFMGKIEGSHFFLGIHAKKQPMQFTEVTRESLQNPDNGGCLKVVERT